MSNVEAVIKQCVDVLSRIKDDDTVPRNIRRSADNVKNILLDTKESPAVRAASSISILDEISNDPNIPLLPAINMEHRSQLETISVEG